MSKLLGRKGLRAYWSKAKVAQCHADRCLYPGRPIDYSGARGPLALDVGHIMPAYLEPHRRLWAVTETRPEHSGCNRAQGSRIARRIARGKRRARVVVNLDTSRAW
jgi:hypothetical protein